MNNLWIVARKDKRGSTLIPAAELNGLLQVVVTTRRFRLDKIHEAFRLLV
jgi:hypothetical protein